MARRCNKTGKVIFSNELDAKIALAARVWKDKGEQRYYPCKGHGKRVHYHLTSMGENRGDGHEAVAPRHGFR